jgi:hypothetical protein
MSKKTFLVQKYEAKCARRLTVGGGSAFVSQIVCIGGDGTRLVLFFVSPSNTMPNNTYIPSAKWGESHLPADQFNWYQDLLRREKQVYAYLNSDHPLANGLFTAGVRVGEVEELPNLEAWLFSHPQVSDTMIWEDAKGTHPYAGWSITQKGDLAEAFETAWFAAPDEILEPLPNEAILNDSDFVVQALSEKNAWELYVAFVAHCLAIEIGGGVAWSITSYSKGNLALLFDCRKMFSWNSADSQYYINFQMGLALPAPPRYTHDFLVREGLIADNRFHTIGRLLDWCRRNLVHYTGQRQASNMEKQWQYRGFPPVSRILQGTPHNDRLEQGMYHRTAGCHGTLGFLRAILRCVNIPVNPNHMCGHALPHFPTEESYMSHGDDPYGRLSRGTPAPFPGTSLMISSTTYNLWFGPGAGKNKCDNIGRQVRELALVHLPPYLLEKHCNDLAKGISHADSTVAEAFKREYSVAELESMDLWGRIEAKIDDLGGCDHISSLSEIQPHSWQGEKKMATATFQISTYKIELARHLTIGKIQFYSCIVCSGGGYNLLIYFLKPDSPEMDNIYSVENKRGIMVVPWNHFPVYVDLLRNEKPIYATLDSESPLSNRIFTGQEPTGEGED